MRPVEIRPSVTKDVFFEFHFFWLLCHRIASTLRSSMFGATTVEIGLKSFGWEISSKGLKLPYTVFGNMNFFSTCIFLATLSSNSVHTTFKYVWGNHGRDWAQKFWVGNTTPSFGSLGVQKILTWGD